MTDDEREAELAAIRRVVLKLVPRVAAALKPPLTDDRATEIDQLDREVGALLEWLNTLREGGPPMPMASDDAELDFLVAYYRDEFNGMLRKAIGPRMPPAPDDTPEASARIWKATAELLVAVDQLEIDGRMVIPALAQALGGMCRAAANEASGRDDPTLAQAFFLFVVFIGLNVAGADAPPP